MHTAVFTARAAWIRATLARPPHRVTAGMLADAFDLGSVKSASNWLAAHRGVLGIVAVRAGPHTCFTTVKRHAAVVAEIQAALAPTTIERRLYANHRPRDRRRRAPAQEEPRPLPVPSVWQWAAA